MQNYPGSRRARPRPRPPNARDARSIFWRRTAHAARQPCSIHMERASDGSAAPWRDFFDVVVVSRDTQYFRRRGTAKGYLSVTRGRRDGARRGTRWYGRKG